jgi:hypothetical protein
MRRRGTPMTKRSRQTSDAKLPARANIAGLAPATRDGTAPEMWPGRRGGVISVLFRHAAYV